MKPNLFQWLLATSVNNSIRSQLIAAFIHTYKIPRAALSTRASSIHRNTSDGIMKLDKDLINKGLTVGLDEALPFSEMPEPGGLAKIPYIGALFLFRPFTNYTFQTIGKMACDLHDRLGPVFRLRLGKDYIVYTCDVKIIENIFRHEPRYPQRRLLNLTKTYRERSGLPQTLGSLNGPEWHELRKPLNIIFKRPKAVLSYLPSIDEVADEFVERLLEISAKDNSPHNAEELQGLFFKYGCEGIGMACFNERMGFLSKELASCPDKKKLLDSIKIILVSVFRDVIGLERKYVTNENDKFYLDFAAAMDYLREQSMIYVNKVIDKTKIVGEDKNDDDTNLLETLVRRKDLTMEQILALIDSLIIGGTESTARVLTIILYDMATNNEIQEQVADEVHRVLGPTGRVERESIDQMRLLKACVKESMRLHYPVSSGLERNMPHDTVIGGYRVPAGTSIIVAGVKTSKLPEHFQDPLTFAPHRWMREQHLSTFLSNDDTVAPPTDNNKPTGCPINHKDEESDAPNASVSSLTKSPRFAFIPFGHGSRSCLGNRFSEMELYLATAKVVQKLRVSIHPSYGSLEVKYTPFITPLKPIPFIFKQR